MLQLLLNARSSLRPHGWTSARTFESYSSVAGAPRLCSFGTVYARSYTWDPPAPCPFFKFRGCHHSCRSHVVMRIAAAVRNTEVVSNFHGWVPGLAEQFWFGHGLGMNSISDSVAPSSTHMILPPMMSEGAPGMGRPTLQGSRHLRWPNCQLRVASQAASKG